MKSENYKRDIEFLIEALKEFEAKGLHTKSELEKAAFEGITGVNIQNTVFGILNTEDLPSHPDFRTYTKKRFWELGVESEIKALEEVIAFHADITVPLYIEGMVQLLDEHIEELSKIPEIKRKTTPIDQSFEARFRRAVYFYETQRAANDLLPRSGVYFVDAEKAEEMKDVIKSDIDSFNQIFAKKIAEKTKIANQYSQQVAKDYSSYAVNIEEGQNLPVIDLQKVKQQPSTIITELSDILATDPQIQQIAKLYMLPAFFADPLAVENLIGYANKNPQELKAALSSELQANGIDEGKTDNLVNQYVQRVNELKPKQVVPYQAIPFINTRSELIEELPRPKPNLEKTIDKFGANKEAVRVAIQQTLKQGILPVAPIVNAQSENIVSQAKEVLDENLAQNIESTTVSNETSTIIALPVSGFFATSAGKSYVKTVAALAAPTINEEKKDKDPSFTSSMQIYYQLGVTADQFKSIAKSIGFNDTETAQFIKNLRDFQSIHPFIATGGLSPTKAERLISVFRKNDEQLYNGSEWYGNFEDAFPGTGIDGFFLRAERQVLGKSAGNIFNGWIEKGLAKLGNKVAENALKETLKGAATAASSAIPGIGPLLSRLAIEIISRFGPFLKRAGGLLAVGGAALGGLVFLGIPGGIIAGGGTAFLVGVANGGSFQAGVSMISGGVGALGGAIASEVVIPLIIAIISIPAVVALILFIINTGAYVVPPAGTAFLGSPGPAGLGCPSGWPVQGQTELGDRSLYVIQGPRGTFSHQNIEAIDISSSIGHSVTARHSGIVYGAYPDMKGAYPYESDYGKLVIIQGTCNGQVFYSFYAHNSVIEVQTGQSISFGQEIAKSGDTSSTPQYRNPHVHYEFRTGGGASHVPGPYPNNPPFMAPPYLPKYVPIYCYGFQSCGVVLP